MASTTTMASQSVPMASQPSTTVPLSSIGLTSQSATMGSQGSATIVTQSATLGSQQPSVAMAAPSTAIGQHPTVTTSQSTTVSQSSTVTSQNGTKGIQSSTTTISSQSTTTTMASQPTTNGTNLSSATNLPKTAAMAQPNVTMASQSPKPSNGVASQPPQPPAIGVQPPPTIMSQSTTSTTASITKVSSQSTTMTSEIPKTTNPSQSKPIDSKSSTATTMSTETKTTMTSEIPKTTIPSQSKPIDSKSSAATVMSTETKTTIASSQTATMGASPQVVTSTLAKQTNSTPTPSKPEIIQSSSKTNQLIESTTTVNNLQTKTTTSSTLPSNNKSEKNVPAVITMSDSSSAGEEIQNMRSDLAKIIGQVQVGPGGEQASSSSIGQDVSILVARIGQMGRPQQEAEERREFQNVRSMELPGSVFQELSSASASPKMTLKENQEQGDIQGRVPRVSGEKTFQVKSHLTSAKQPSSAKSRKQVTSAKSESTFSASSTAPTTERKTRTSRGQNLTKSPLAADASPELLAKTFSGSSPSSTLRPSSSLYRPTSSSAAKKNPAAVASSSGASPNLRLKSAKSVVGYSSGKSTPSPNRAKMGDAGANGNGSPAAAGAAASAGGGEKPNLRDQFAAFSRFGDATSDGKQITLSNCDKWMKQSHVIDGKKITTTDTSIAFKKLFKTAKKVGFEDFKKYVEDLAASKKMEPQEIFDKLASAGTPGLSQATKAASAGVVERLTDTSKYTGSHKERFDSAGKGKGIVGRREVADNTGYTAAFNDKKKEDSASPAAAK